MNFERATCAQVQQAGAIANEETERRRAHDARAESRLEAAEQDVARLRAKCRDLPTTPPDDLAEVRQTLQVTARVPGFGRSQLRRPQTVSNQR